MEVGSATRNLVMKTGKSSILPFVLLVNKLNDSGDLRVCIEPFYPCRSVMLVSKVYRSSLWMNTALTGHCVSDTGNNGLDFKGD